MSDWHQNLCLVVTESPQLFFSPPNIPTAALSLLSRIHGFIRQVQLNYATITNHPDIFVVHNENILLVYFNFSYMLIAGQLLFCSMSSLFWDLD